MSLPSQDVLDDIRELISEITGFKEDDENFTICERYCLSHVVHHTYPFVNKSTVINLVDSYVSRFYGHGYFKVSQELNNQVKSFLSNEKLFEKNPQYDIQWSLLSLISSLSSNLTSVKEIPELLPIDDEENEIETFDWKEYLAIDLPQSSLTSSNENEEETWEEESEDDEDEEGNKINEKTQLGTSTGENSNEKSGQEKKNLHVIFDNKMVFDTKISSEIRKQRIEEFLKSKRSEKDLECDLRVRGNITEIFDKLMNKEGIIRKPQLVSEFEVMENILFQLETGERIFLRKGLVNPALTSLTQETLSSFLESLQPYFKIIRCFKDFDTEITQARYPENCLDLSLSVSDKKGCQSFPESRKQRKIPNVLHMYNVMLKKALKPFHNEVTEIVENLGNYTLIQMEKKLKPYYNDLIFLYHIHTSAIKNWKKDCNWLSSIRILSVLYTSIMNTTSTKMSFLCLNLFLHCFQVYLDIMDSWISSLNLIDPNDEFIVAKCGAVENNENRCSEYKIRPYKTEIENWRDNIVVLDLIADKMVHVGQSLDVLKRLNRFVQEKETPDETSHDLLVKAIKEKILTLGKVESIPKKLKPPEKQKSIFTVRNISLGLERDNGGGDSSLIGNLLMEILKEDEEKEEKKINKVEETKSEKSFSFSSEVMKSIVGNPFFRIAFDDIGIKKVEKQLERAKTRQKEDFEEKALMIIQKPEEGKSGIYPIHKIISEAFHTILENRVSSACALVKDIVLNECHLLTHLSILRSILLFNDSYLLEPFILALFTQPAIWGNAYSLSFHLKECVRGFYKDYANDLSVILSNINTTRCENILQVIDSITINYEVKWPLTLIITQEAMEKYNVIFRLALKVKWAHWALSGLLLLQDKNQKGTNQHRLQLLRFWILSDIGRISNYFLTQMTPLDLKLDSCNDLKSIIQGHSRFLDRIYYNFLFGEKSTEGRKLIVKTLLPLCMDLLGENSDMDEAKLSSIEKTFGSCHLVLSQLLSSLED